ncbi:MAG: ATP-binding protein [Helicobacter trogontum]|uniref:ATP-binding protein n=1 Tax=Helicobacter trogontum TaxID=50960 RepID=A0ABQ0D546_9HELI|nr:ATP-binding protein [Helicobacter trogontum]MCI5786408.1 ATP-binding protein [Helicobacter trogontum]
MFNEIPKLKHIFPRSVNINSNKTFIYGPPQSGKTTLALWYAQKFQYVFYVDFAMLFSKNLIENTQKALHNIGQKLELLIVDNITLDTIKYCNDMIVSCPCIYIGDIGACPSDFTPLSLLPLSFEEYLSIDSKNLSIEALLSNFIKDGNAIEMLLLPEYKKREYKWRSMQFSLKEEANILSHMLSLQSLKTSTYGIYTHLKQHIKISKDRIYPLIQSLQANNIVHVCKHADTYGIDAGKKYKLYFYDFTLASEFADSKHFMRVYENMVFLELVSMGFSLQYSNYCDFIDKSQQMIFLCMPFAGIESIAKRIQLIRKKEREYSNYMIYVITMGSNHVFDTKAIGLDFASLSPLLRLV